MLRESALRAAFASFAIAGCVAGCTEGSITRDAPEASLVVRTGFACARGCALDRPMLTGTELVADVIAGGGLDGAIARSIDPTIATAWIEPVRLCCGPGLAGSCHAMALGETACGGEETKHSRVVIRAMRVGETAIELRDAHGLALEAIALRVEDAIEVSAIATLGAVEADDVTGGPVDAPSLSQEWVDGRLARIDLRASEVAHVRITALGPDGRELMVGAGVGARIVDPTIAHVGPASAICSGEVAEGPLVVVTGVRAGATVLALQAGSATGAVEIVVGGACEPLGRVAPTAVACRTDADCVPAGCCHPATCVAAAQAPSCGDALCTLECRADTLDCGGRCLCLEGRCAAYLPSLPDPTCATGDDDLGPILDPSDLPRDAPTEGPF